MNVVLVADTDLLADRLWVQTQDFFGQRLSTAFANNGDLAVNALDNLLGSGDLIGIRSRATFQRPFTRVQDLRREAESRFRSAEQRLQDELSETEARLGELQASRTDEGHRDPVPAAGGRNRPLPGAVGSSCARSCARSSASWTRISSGSAPC